MKVVIVEIRPGPIESIPEPRMPKPKKPIPEEEQKAK